MMIGQTQYQRQYAAQGRYILDLNKIRLSIYHLTNMLAGAGMEIRSVPQDGVPVPSVWQGGMPPLGPPFTQHPAQTQGQPSQPIQPIHNAPTPRASASMPNENSKERAWEEDPNATTEASSSSVPSPK
ncbi:hypothetical protein OF83DRAFT_1174070 [Amylostereum chailletii]|nr:hypothetical protein OF83DRAFT_1174070 [Amylostereum chailletii]